MRVNSAKLDGEQAEIYVRESVRNGLVEVLRQRAITARTTAPTYPGSTHEVEMEVEGTSVVQMLSRGVYAVTARGNWYPDSGLQFPASTPRFVTRRSSSRTAAKSSKTRPRHYPHHPPRRERTVRMLGVNLGEYVGRNATKDSITVEAFANKQVEDNLQSPVAVQRDQPTIRGRQLGTTVQTMVARTANPQPRRRARPHRQRCRAGRGVVRQPLRPAATLTCGRYANARTLRPGLSRHDLPLDSLVLREGFAPTRRAQPTLTSSSSRI
jgi:hypothetical protein